MQPMISFVPTTPTMGNQLPAAGGGEQAGAGIFQGMLLEAMLGARGAQAAVQLLPGVPVQPGGQGQAQVPVQPGEAQVAAGTDAQEAAMLPVLTTVPAPQMQQPQPAPENTEGPAATLPIRLTGPVPPATLPAQPDLVPVLPVDPALLTEEEADGQAPPAAAEADSALVSQVQAAQVQVLSDQTRTSAPTPVPPSEPQSPAPGQQAVPAIHQMSGTDAELEAFVQKAVQAAKGETPVAAEGPEPAQADAAPTFQDLVKLVMDADQAGTGGGSSQTQQNGAQSRSQDAPTNAEPAAPVAEAPTPDAGAVAAGPEPAPAARPTVAATPEGLQEAPRQPVEPEPVLRQVTRFIKVMVDTKQSEVRLNLHPEHLGHIAVKLVVGDGAIRANLIAQDMAVKAALEANLDQLKTRLSDQGFQVEQVHVTVGSDSGLPQHSRQGEQRQPQQQSQWRPAHGQATQQQDPSPAPSRPAPAPWSVRGTGVRLNSLA